MDAIEKLRAEALAKRDRAIRQAKREYSSTLASIREVSAKLKKRPKAESLRPAVVGDDLSGLSTAAAAEKVLQELGPMTLIEITAEIQARGCHAGDNPLKLKETLRAGMKYHAGRFVKGEDGRWRAD